MKIMIDDLDPDQQVRGLRIAQAYIGEYMRDGRGCGPRHCVIFTNAVGPDLAVWHTKTGRVTVRQTGEAQAYRRGEGRNPNALAECRKVAGPEVFMGLLGRVKALEENHD